MDEHNLVWSLYLLVYCLFFGFLSFLVSAQNLFAKLILLIPLSVFALTPVSVGSSPNDFYFAPFAAVMFIELLTVGVPGLLQFRSVIAAFFVLVLGLVVGVRLIVGVEESSNLSD